MPQVKDDREITLQLDDSTPHFGRIVRESLSRHFLGRWIGSL
jgi:hypothetical protein